MEALFKFATHRGSKPSFAALIGSEGQLPSEACYWHRYSLPHSDLTIVVCSDRRLAALTKIELTDLSPAKWLNESHVVNQCADSR